MDHVILKASIVHKGVKESHQHFWNEIISAANDMLMEIHKPQAKLEINHVKISLKRQ